MRTIYVDSEWKCHVADDGTRLAVETDFFDGKCDAFVEGYCYEETAKGISVYPWEDYAELDAAQAQYDRAKLQEYELLINELYEEVL